MATPRPRSPRFGGWFTGRNRWITLGSLAAVGITGSMAFGANLGLLNAAAGSKAPVAIQPASSDVTNTTIVDVYVTDPTAPSAPVATQAPAPTTPSAQTQQYQVGPAGVVTLEQGTSQLKVAAVSTAKGYTWNSLQPTAHQVVVNILSGTKRYQFRASLDTNGAVKVAVTETTPSPNQPPAGGGGGDDGGESDD